MTFLFRLWTAGVVTLSIVCLYTLIPALGDSEESVQLTGKQLGASLATIEECTIVLDDYARRVMHANVSYLGVLGAKNGAFRKRIRSTGMFQFVGDSDHWGNMFWTCRLIETPKGEESEFKINVGNTVVWFSIDTVGQDYNDILLSDAKRKDGMRLSELVHDISNYEAP